MKHTYRLSLPDWAVPQQQERYARLAEKGWRVEKAGAYLTRYAAAPPACLLYRLEAAPAWRQDPPEEQKKLYEECGWNFVCNRGYFNLFCADQSAPELHSDASCHFETLEPVRRSLRRQVISNIAWVMVLIGLFFISWKGNALSRGLPLGQWLALLLCEAGPGILLVYFLTVLGKAVAPILSWAAVGRYSGRARRGQALHTVPAALCRVVQTLRLALLAFGVLALAWLGIAAAFPRLLPMGQEPEGRYLLNMETLHPGFTLKDDPLVEHNGLTQVYGTFFAPCWMQNNQSDGEEWLRQRYYRVRWLNPETIAQAAVNYYSIFGDAQAVEEKDLPMGLEFAMLSPEDGTSLKALCAVRGGRVLAVQYLGPLSREQLLEAAAQALDR